MCICFSILAVQFEIAPWTRADEDSPTALEPELNNDIHTEDKSMLVLTAISKYSLKSL